MSGRRELFIGRLQRLVRRGPGVAGGSIVSAEFSQKVDKQTSTGIEHALAGVHRRRLGGVCKTTSGATWISDPAWISP